VLPLLLSLSLSSLWSLLPGHPAIRLVDSPQKREYRVLNEKQTTRRPTPPSLTPVSEETTPPPPPSLPHPHNSHHSLPFPLPVPHAVSKESPQGSQAKKFIQPAVAARLCYDLVGGGAIGSPLNLPSKSRKGLHQHLQAPGLNSSLAERALPSSGHSLRTPPPVRSDQRQDPSSSSKAPTVKSTLANIWNQTEIEFSDDSDKEERHRTPFLSPPANLSPVLADHSEIPPRVQSGSLSAGLVSEGAMKASVSSQRSRSESDLECRYDTPGGFILPPPSTSPSFPLSLSGGSGAPSNPPLHQTPVDQHDFFTDEQKESYSRLLSPNSRQAVVAPIVPLESNARALSSIDSPSTEDHYGELSPRKVSVGVQVSFANPPEPPETAPRAHSSGLVQEEVRGVLESQSTELLGKMVLQAAEETAFSYQTINTLGGKRKDVFKACQQVLTHSATPPPPSHLSLLTGPERTLRGASQHSELRARARDLPIMRSALQFRP
jgi:hypothetical protein